MKIRAIAVVATLVGMAFSGAAVANVPATSDQMKPATDILLSADTSSDQALQVALSDFAKGAIVGGVVSGIIVNERNKSRYRREPRYYRGGGGGYQGAKRRCANRYRSYSWRTDTFVTYGGVEKLCPYVRPYY